MDHTGAHFLIISISSISKRNSEMTSFFCNRIEFTLRCILNGSNHYKNHIITLTSYSLGEGGVKVCGPILDASEHLSKNIFLNQSNQTIIYFIKIIRDKVRFLCTTENLMTVAPDHFTWPPRQVLVEKTCLQIFGPAKSFLVYKKSKYRLKLCTFAVPIKVSLFYKNVDQSIFQ